MKDKITEANLSMILSKTLSGLNINALKYLLPVWIAPVTGVTIRVCFAAVAFCLIDIFTKPDTSTTREKVLLFLLGAFGLYGFMFLYLVGLSTTTPVSAAIFSSTQPIWVFLISALFLKEKVTGKKVFGILLGLGGALLCISTQQSDDLASDAFTGNMLNLFSSILYAGFLILSNKILMKVSSLTMLKYAFLGAAFMSLIVNCFYGFHAPLFNEPIHWWPMALLIFVLIFPTTLSYLLVPVGLKYLNATIVAIYGYLMLVVATIVSLAIGQDRFSWWQVLSIILIVLSVYFVEIAEKK